MKYVTCAFGLLLALLGTYHANAAQSIAKAELHSATGKTVGIATLTAGSDGIRVALQVNDLPPGLHGFHIHAAARCEQPDFMSAGGHFNPYGKHHGLKNPEGMHAGDMPNILVEPNGSATALLLVPLVTLATGKNSLFQSEGTAVVIHAGTDDQMSDPAGTPATVSLVGLSRNGNEGGAGLRQLPGNVLLAFEVT